MSDEPQVAERELPMYIIEGARSGRSRCKVCRRAVDKNVLRLGVLIEGPYGTGHIWHHLTCAARRKFDNVEEAYEVEAWKEAKSPPEGLPSLDELRKLSEQAEVRRQKRKQIPYAELSPTGRAKCKHCGESMAKDSLRVVLGREVQFGSQVRTSPINVHPHCVASELKADDCSTKIEGFEAALRANSADLATERVEALIGEIGAMAEGA